VDDPGEFIVKHKDVGGRKVGVVCGNNSQGVLDGVYSFLEQKVGYGFYLDTTANIDKGPFSFDKWDLSAKPAFTERVSMNWYNFISGVTSWNLEDYKKWIRQCARMRHTSVMLHTYSYSPFTDFTYKGKSKDIQYIHNTAIGDHWGNRHTEDVRKLVGGDVFADEGPVFGTDCSKVGHGGVTEENRVARSKEMMREVIDYAVNTVGIEFNWSFDIDTFPANPKKIIADIPKADKFKCGKGWLVRPDTEEGYLYYKNIIQTTMTDYPDLTTITAWWRCFTDYTHEGLANNLKPSELPEAWQAEYNAAPAEAKSYGGPGNLYYAKVTQAYRRALDELGHKDVKLGYGSWWLNSENLHGLFAAANHFQDKAVTAYALEYHMILDQSASYRAELKKSGSNRRLIVIEWAQHDMGGQYLGRPTTPPENFKDNLTEAGASGYGVLHWMTRPLDIYFKSCQNQIWSNSLNEDISTTCRKMAVDFIGESQAEHLAEYLEEWVTNGPRFIGATQPNWTFGGKKKKGKKSSPAAIARGCDDRIAILEKVDTAELSADGLKRWKYFRGHEEWIKLIFLSTDAESKKKAIRKYVEKTSIDGGMTRGEMGILIQQNLKWLGEIKE
jgi:hypothetical protein